MALLLSYIPLKSGSKLAFKMNAWSKDEEKLVKDLNGISAESREPFLDDLFPNLSAGEGQSWHLLLLSTAVSLKQVHRPKLC